MRTDETRQLWSLAPEIKAQTIKEGTLVDMVTTVEAVTDEELDELARSTLKAYMQDTEPDKRDETRAKVAASVFSTVARRKQTNSAVDALRWNMAERLLDKERLQEYIRVSAPDSALAKALPAGK